MLSRGPGELPWGRLSCFLGEEVGCPESPGSARRVSAEAPLALSTKGSSRTSQPWELLVCRPLPSAAPGGSLLGGRAHLPPRCVSQAGFLLRALPHLGLLPASSVSEKHMLGSCDLVLDPDASLTASWAVLEQRDGGGGGGWGPCRPSCPAGRLGCSPSRCAQTPSQGREAFVQEVWG